MSESLQATEDFRQMWSDRKRKERERLTDIPSSVSEPLPQESLVVNI